MQSTLKISIPFLTLTYLVIFLCWLLYRYFIHFPDVTTELIVKPIFWIGPVIAICFWKKKSLNELNFKKLPLSFTLLSVISGTSLAALQFFPIYLQNHKLLSIPPNLAVLTIATISTALSEEILFRGFFFKEFQKYYSPLVSNGITSILFAVMHLPILIFTQNISGISLLLSLYIIFASSVVFCFLYNYTKSLWASVIAHFVLDILLLFF